MIYQTVSTIMINKTMLVFRVVSANLLEEQKCFLSMMTICHRLAAIVLGQMSDAHSSYHVNEDHQNKNFNLIKIKKNLLTLRSASCSHDRSWLSEVSAELLEEIKPNAQKYHGGLIKPQNWQMAHSTCPHYT